MRRHIINLNNFKQGTIVFQIVVTSRMFFRSLFPCGDHMVCIIDDREDVWNYAPNLVKLLLYLILLKVKLLCELHASTRHLWTESSVTPVHFCRSTWSLTSSSRTPATSTRHRGYRPNLPRTTNLMLTFSEKVINLQFKYLLDFIAVKSRPHERQKRYFFKRKNALFFGKLHF